MMARTRPIVLTVLLAITVIPPAARAGGSRDCAGKPTPQWDWQGAWEQTSVRYDDGSGHVFTGTLFTPGYTDPGVRLPAVALQHAFNDDECGLWWAARGLAGHGYVAVTFNSDRTIFEPKSERTLRAAVAFLADPAANPASGITDVSRVGLAGHSTGSAAAVNVQGAEPRDERIRAVVAYDNLARYADGKDRGSAALCPLPGREGTDVRPRVPALGISNDAPCIGGAPDLDPDVKKSGYTFWRDSGQWAMLVAARDTDHTTFSQNMAVRANHSVLLERSFHYTLAWFDLWVKQDESALERLRATSVDGVPATGFLSWRYRSAASLPGFHCEDLSSCLSDARGSARAQEATEGQDRSSSARQSGSIHPKQGRQP